MRAERPCPVQSPTDGTSTNDESSPSWASCSSTPSYTTTGLAFEFNHRCTISEESLHYLSSSSSGQLNVAGVPLSPSEGGCSFLFGGGGSTTSASERRRRGCSSVGGGSGSSFGGIDGRTSACRTRGSRASCDDAQLSGRSGAGGYGGSGGGGSGSGGGRAGLASASSTSDIVESLLPGEDIRSSSLGVTSACSTSASTTTTTTASGGSIARLSHFLKRTQSVAPPPLPAHALFLRKPVSKTKSADIACDEPRKKTLAQDVRLRLGFLRRRNTDTSIRPPPDEAQRWAESFIELTSSKYGLALFRAFLSREFSEENIDFWLAVEDFKKLSTRPHKLASKARKIFEDYVAVQSPKEVNLEASTRNAIQDNLDNVDIHMFDQAQRRVQGLMEQDAYIRFLQCDLYQDLLRQ